MKRILMLLVVELNAQPHQKILVPKIIFISCCIKLPNKSPLIKNSISHPKLNCRQIYIYELYESEKFLHLFYWFWTEQCNKKILKRIEVLSIRTSKHCNVYLHPACMEKFWRGCWSQQIFFSIIISLNIHSWILHANDLNVVLYNLAIYI